MFPLKPLSSSAVPAALAKAERYRLLNEPEQCESICEDVLRADPGNHPATVMLILAITDRFPQDDRGRQSGDGTCQPACRPTTSASYYAGLVAERRARALLSHGGMGRRGASQWLQQAMAALRPCRCRAAAGQRRCPAEMERVRARVFNAASRLADRRRPAQRPDHAPVKKDVFNFFRFFFRPQKKKKKKKNY